MRTGPIGRTAPAAGVRPGREGNAPAERDRVARGERGGVRQAPGVPEDQVTISPTALRGLRDGGGEPSGDAAGDQEVGTRTVVVEDGGVEGDGEALRLARAVAGALLAEPRVGARVHDRANPSRVAALLRD